VSTLSAWENVSTPALPPADRLVAYARFFATARSLHGGPHLLTLTDLTDAEDATRRERSARAAQRRGQPELYEAVFLR
jgi:hypothetical protein